MSVNSYITNIAQNIGQVPRNQALSNAAFGINILGRNAPLQLNTENHGYTFFTKPLFNLSYDNCMVDRRLSMLLREDKDCLERLVRVTLDPWSMTQEQNPLTSTMVDPLSPFIPILSNNLISLNGWPDFTINMSTTTAGIYRDSMAYVDDVPYQYETFTLQGTYRNVEGDPVTLLHYMWLLAQGLGKEGRTMPYPELVMMNERDYDTRIYRLIMDQTRTYVTRIFACGAATPENAPTGEIANYTGDGSETGSQVISSQLNFSYRCNGVTTYDHILIFEFNDLQQDFNPGMRDDTREATMQLLYPWEKSYFNYRAYPRINPSNMELEWWVFKADYEAMKAGNIRKAPAPTTTQDASQPTEATQ
ncbi:virion structural protein [Pseudomonas phage Psa21]|uniref:Virion structural protein n=1 Tax=Pseudomonas phage Psa21 TaxID=2530023 RepID=A0A481W4H1_9CAUD|nr:virion structural protein [Pseudomonas phage Psa21]QBJ02626.1 virion structural protein [Pseudomonas phage Psa21]